MAKKIRTREANYNPVCPHCDSELTEIHWRQMPATNAEYIFNCPDCRKVLGIGVRKAGWMS